MTQTKSYWHYLCLALVALVVTAAPEIAFASEPPEAFGGVLCELVSWFNGPVGRAIAMIAVIVVGVGALMGKVSWGQAVMVAIGIAVIFGAASIVNSLGAASGGEAGGGNECDAV